MSFRITEEYVQAALELERAGYEWLPGPGDWILDRDDHSIGMLTTPVHRPEMIRRLNIHLPTNAQVDEMLAGHGIELRRTALAEFVRRGRVVCAFDAQEYDRDMALCRLKVLTACFELKLPRR